jgi:ligand-binding sensor domain-containing protein
MRSAKAPVSILLTAVLPACGVGEPPRTAGAEPVQISDYPSSPFEDRHGLLWFPTAFDGVIRYDGSGFVAFTILDGLASNTVRDVLEDRNGTLWFATGAGLSRYDGRSFATLTGYADADIDSGPGFGGAGHHLDLWDVHEDRHGALWIATLDGVFRHEGGVFVRVPLDAQRGEHHHEFTSNMVYRIFEDRDGVLWFGTDGAGVVRADGEGQTTYTSADGLCSDHVCEIVQDRRGDFWFGTSNGGVSRYDGRSFRTYLRSETLSEHTGWGRFLGMLVDRQGTVWFGRASTGGGAVRYDGASFEHLSGENGPGHGSVIGISEDRRGHLWFGTNRGVYRFDGERFVNFTRPATR